MSRRSHRRCWLRSPLSIPRPSSSPRGTSRRPSGSFSTSSTPSPTRFRTTYVTGTVSSAFFWGSTPPPRPRRAGDTGGRGLIGLCEAPHLAPLPQTREDYEQARERLKWDEAFVLQTVLAQRRAA